MRQVCAAAAAMGLLVLVPSEMFGQPGSGLSITNYQLVSEQRISGTESIYGYRATLVNAGAARSAVTATVSSAAPHVQVMQANLHFMPVPANSQVASLDTFSILVNRTSPFNPSTDLQWTFVAPFANAGPDQTAAAGSTVTLNAGGSSNPSGTGFLSYTWTFLSRPAGSAAILRNATTVMATFVVDAPGTYVAKLTVGNGAGTDTDTITISTANTPPVANAGPNQTVATGSTVILNGSASSDVNGDPLTYAWTLTQRPAGSTAVLTGASSVSPGFIADKAGTYVAQLIVNDGKVNSAPSAVTITTQNTAPVANAGPNQVVTAGATVQLNGAASTDVDGDPLTYHWSLITMPAGSTAALNSTTAVNPTFVADKDGTYVAQLIVNDGKVNSTPDTVTITTDALQAPTANAGQNQTVKHGSLVTLNGSGTDPQGRPLTFQWSLLSRPAGSTAALSGTTAAQTSFVADIPGNYVAQLIVNNGFLNSAPSTVTITTTNSAPVANAGINQSVATGSTVTLNGLGSSDADGDALTFSWSFTSRPVGSNAALQAANSYSPTFVADAAGTYVVQLIVSDKFTSSAPATVTITATAMTITLTPDPLNLTAGSPGTLTVTLGAPAGPAGQQVAMAVLDEGVASMPSNVVIPAGQTSANVTVTPGAAGNTTVTGAAPGFRTGTATINVGVPRVVVTLASNVIGLTRTTTGTVTLTTAAPAAGTTVNLLAVPGGIVKLQPASVSIPGGEKTGTFTVTGAAEGTAFIIASSAGYSSGPAARITVGKLGQISLQPVSVLPGQSVPVQVSLLTPAPVDGVTITLASSNPSIFTVSPASVQIPAGATTPPAPPQVTGVNFGSATLTASAPGLTGDSQTVTVSASLSFSPASLTVLAGGTQNLTLNLSAPAPAGGLTVNLSSSATGVATVPASVVIAQGATSASVPVTGVSAGSATVNATPASPSVTGTSAAVIVTRLGSITMPAGGTVGLGQTIPAQIALTANAPAGGVTVSLASSNTLRATVSPAAVNIPAGSNAPAAQPQIAGIGIGQVTVSASAPGFGTASRTLTVTASLSLTPANLTISGAATGNLTLTLSGPAPAGGLTVNLSSDTPAVATVPANITIAENTTTATVTVTAVSAGTTMIRATATGITQATANVTVQTAGTINLPANVQVAPGHSAAFPVTLSSPAAANVTVSLVSSNTSRVIVSPASVTIPAGQTQPAQQPQVTGVNFGSPTITASAPGYTPATRIVRVGAALSFAAQNVVIPGAATQNVALNLSSDAPVGGLAVTLSSSNPAAATVPASVTIPQGASTVNVPITGVAAGTATVTAASSAPNVTSATTTVTVQSAGGGIVLPAGQTVAVGQSKPFPVTLPAPAPAGGVTVALASSDTAKLTISPANVTVAAGQTQPAQQPQITGVSPGTANVSASAPGFGSATQAVQVTGSLAFTPPTLTINGTGTQNLTLTLSAPAPAGGLTITLSSNNTAVATVPATVSVPQNTTTVPVPVTGVAPGTATVRATAPNLGEAMATVTVAAAADIILPADMTVAPGASVTFPVSLAKAAPQTTFVSLSSSDTSKATLTLQNIVISAGQTQPISQPRVNGVAAGTVTITASAAGLATATATVQVGYRINFSPPDLSVTGTATRNFTLVLSAPAPAGGLTVNLTSSNTGVARVPASVSFPASATSVNVPVTGVAPGTAAVRANAAGIPEATGNVTVVAPGSITLPVNTSIQLGESVPFPVTLSTPAPAGGVTVTLASNNTSRLTIAPASVHIAAGQTQPAAQPVITGVNVGAANISASAPGYAAATATVQIGATVTWNKPSVTVRAGTTTSLLLALSASAPWVDGVTVTLTSSNTGVATVQSTITFFPDGSAFTTLSIPITAVAQGTAVITAAGTNIPPAATTINVVGPVAITTPSLPNGSVGSAYSHTLAASGGVTPYTWALTAGTLPNGVNLNAATGQISGTPTVAVTNRSLTFRVTDSSSPADSATRTLTLTIAQQVAASITATSGSGQSTGVNTAFASPLVATVKDANGNPVSGATVTFTAPPSGASGTFAAGASTAVTNASGVATSAVFTANGTLGSYNVTASVPGVSTPATFALTNIAGAPASISATSGTPQSAPVNTAFANPLRATVRDSGNNPVSGVTVTFAAPAAGASATFGGPVNVVTNANGVAVSPVLTANATTGSYTVTASVAGVAGTANFALTNNPGPPASVTAIGGSGQSATINTAFANPLAATVKDASGNPLSGITVTFTAPASGAGGSFTGGVNTAVTNASGVATSAVFRANGTAGQYSVTASVAGVQTPAAFALSNTAAPPASVTVTSGSGQSAMINTAFAAPLVVTVRDAGGNGIGGVTVTFSAPGTGASGSFANGANTAVTNSSGVATSAVFSANGTVGTYAVTAAVSGVTPASFTLANTAGTAASITATGGSGQSATISTVFASRLTATVKDAGGNPVENVTVTFNAPPTGPGVTFSGGVNTAVTNSSGVATSALMTANATAGSYNVTASVPGVQTPAVFALTNRPGPPASITATSGSGQSTQINQAFAAPLAATVKDASGNPVGNVTVTFTPPASGARGTFAGGVNTAVTNSSGVATSAVFTANSTAGSYNVTASATGVQTAANFALTNTPGPPTSIVAAGGSGQSVTAGLPFPNRLVVNVRDAGGNPVADRVVTFTAPPSGASGIFPNGTNTGNATTNTSGVATSAVFTANSIAGSYNVIASVAGLQTTASFALTNISAGPPLAITGPAVGKNLQAQIVLTLPGPAVRVPPAPGQPVKIMSLDPSRVLLAGRPGDPGTSEVNVVVGEGLTTLTGIYVHALADTGAVQIQASAAGFTSALATVTMTPSGFLLSGPSGPGGTFTLSQGNNVQVTALAARLNSSLGFAELQQIRGGGLYTVNIANSAPGQATVSPANITIAGGTSNGSATFTATASAAGTATLTATSTGFSVPAGGLNVLNANFIPSGIVAPNATVGQNLQTAMSIGLNSPVPGSCPGPSCVTLPVTITSNDGTKLLFATTPTAVGTASITVNLESGRTSSPPVYFQGLQSSGSATYSVTASGYGSATGTVTLSPSGFVLFGPLGLGASFFTTTGAENSDLTVYSARLDAGGNYVTQQAVRGGLSVNVPVTSSAPAVGTITSSPVTIAAGSGSALTQFNPISQGTSVLSVGTPGGFTAPSQFGSLTATVRQPNLSVTDNIAVGRTLQMIGTVLLGEPAPAGGTAVTLTSNSGELLLSKTSTAAGTPSIVLNIPAGEISGTYYLQAFGDAGAATYTATAPGYVAKTGTVNLRRSGIVIAGPSGFGFALFAPLADGDQPVSVSAALLDSNDAYVMKQQLAGGLSLDVGLRSSTPETGTIESPATITGGSDTATAAFTPAAPGQTTLSIIQPGGYTLPSNFIALLANVN